jgi:hypothetical protein
MSPLSSLATPSAVLAALATVLAIAGPASAQALTAEIAKKCRAEAIKEHPPQPPGSRVGTAQAQRDAYRKCVARETRSDKGARQ